MEPKQWKAPFFCVFHHVPSHSMSKQTSLKWSPQRAATIHNSARENTRMQLYIYIYIYICRYIHIDTLICIYVYMYIPITSNHIIHTLVLEPFPSPAQPAWSHSKPPKFDPSQRRWASGLGLEMSKNYLPRLGPKNEE